MQTPRKAKLFLVLITVAALAPFVNKPFHIDDPLFLWMAQQISAHPLDPYGFQVNWMGVPEPMWHAMQNPPLCSYFIAIVASMFGWSEIALHSAFLIWPVAAILGTFAVAQRCCRHLKLHSVGSAQLTSPDREGSTAQPHFTLPFLVSLLTLFAPVFLVSATNVMCDVMLLAFYVWSIEVWMRGIEQQRWWLLALAMFLVSAAILSKYFGITLLPLLAVYTLMRERRCWRQLIWFCIPIAAVVAYDLLTEARYGHALFIGAASYSRDLAAKYKSPLAAQTLMGLAFIGGCVFNIVFFVPRPSLRSLIGAAVTVAILFAGFYFLVPHKSIYSLNRALTCVEGAVFATAGLSILSLGFLDLCRKRDALSLLLWLWIVGTFVFATFFNWSITARTILPLAPAVAILVLRNIQVGIRTFSFWRVVAGAILALLLTSADFREAQVVRKVSDIFRQRFAAEEGTVWFQSHWGFQYYVQQWGARPLNVAHSEIVSGDVMLVPANNTGVVPISSDRVFPIEELTFASFPLITTHVAATGAGFYSSVRGPLPWAMDYVPPGTYYMARFR
jgi:4-amino-4-deoxy-L-arabinose transferase-like glycosyltransferase